MPEINFDIAAARKAGATDNDIANYFKDNYKIDFDIVGARKAGANDNDILSYLNQQYGDLSQKKNEISSSPSSATQLPSVLQEGSKMVGGDIFKDISGTQSKIEQQNKAKPKQKSNQYLDFGEQVTEKPKRPSFNLFQGVKPTDSGKLPDIKEAIDNAVIEENKKLGVKDKYDMNYNRDKVIQQYQNGDLIPTKDITGKSKLVKGTGFLESFHNAVEEKYNEGIENEALVYSSKEDKIKFLNNRLNFPERYSKQEEASGVLGETGKFLGENIGMLGKATIAGMAASTGNLGTGAESFAQFLSFLPEMTYGGYSGVLQKNYQLLKQQNENISDEEAFDKADAAAKVGSVIGAGTAGVFSGSLRSILGKTPTPNIPINGVFDGIVNSAQHAIKSYPKVGGVSVAGSIVNDLASNAIGAKVSGDEMSENAFESAKQMAIMHFGLWGMTQPFKIPSYLRPQIENIVASAQRQEVKEFYEKGEQNGVFEQGTTNKVLSKLSEFDEQKAVLANMPLSEEQKAAITGKLLQRKKLVEENNDLKKYGESFIDKIKENESKIDQLDKETNGLSKTKDIFKYEKDTQTGEPADINKVKEGEDIPIEEPKAPIVEGIKEEISQPIELSTEITETPTALSDVESIKDRNKQTEAKIKNKGLFLAEYNENGDKIGDSVGEMISQSDVAPIATSVREKNGFEFVEFSNPQTGQVDVIVTGDTKGNYVGFYRLYENGKPTNKWSSKMNSKDKNAFKTMMSGVQEMLPQGHEYSEKTSISTDGLRIWNQQLQKGYELQYDNNGKLITDTVAINGDALVNELGINVNKGNFDNIRVSNKEDFNKVKKALLPYLEKFSLNESNVNWVNGTVQIDLPVLKKSESLLSKEQPTVSETIPALKDVESAAKALEEGNKIQWNVFGNEESGEWTVIGTTKTRGGKDAVILSKVYVESSIDGKSYTKEYADANGIKYDNERIVEHIVPLEDLKSESLIKPTEPTKQPTVSETIPELKDVESTTKALEGLLGKPKEEVKPTETEPIKLTEEQKQKAKETVDEIKKINLTHVEGTGMGSEQADGMYISTEKGGNRYATKDRPAKQVEVEIENPKVTTYEENKSLQKETTSELIEKEALGLEDVETQYWDGIKKHSGKGLSDITPKDVTNWFNSIKDRFKKETYEEYLKESGKLKVAKSITEQLKSEGYDALYIPESKNIEGELIVFDRSKVKEKGKEPSKVEPVKKSVTGIKPPKVEGDKITTISGKTEQERLDSIEKRKKETTVTEKVKAENDLWQDAQSLFSKNKNYLKSSEGLQELNRLRNKARALGFEVDLSRSAIVKKGKNGRLVKLKYNNKADSGAAVNENGIVILDRPKEVQDTFNEFNELGVFLDAKRPDGVRLTPEQIEGAIQDIIDGIPSNRANEYLDLLEKAIDENAYPIYDKGIGEANVRIEELRDALVGKENIGEPMDEESLISFLNEEANLTPEQEEQLLDNIDNLLTEYETEPATELPAETRPETEVSAVESKTEEGVSTKAEPITETTKREPTEIEMAYEKAKADRGIRNANMKQFVTENKDSIIAQLKLENKIKQECK
jgi:hypothetical protein